MRLPRALWRLAAALAQALSGALICALWFPFITPAQRMGHVGRWSARMLGALGITLHARGTVHAGPVLIVAHGGVYRSIRMAAKFTDNGPIPNAHPIKLHPPTDGYAWRSSFTGQ